MLREFFTLRNLIRFCLYLNNQCPHGQMDVTAGFSRSERSRNNLGRNSNCSGRMFYGRVSERTCGSESGLTKTHRYQWLLSFYTYPTNCLALYLLSSMAFTATVCQVYVSGSMGTVLWWFKFRSGKSFFNVCGSFTWLHYNQT